MATAYAILITAWLGLLVGTANGASHCLDCHAAHYETAGDCVGCHSGDADAIRAAVAHHGLWRGAAAAWRGPDLTATDRGAVLRDSLACRRCHISGGQGAGRGIDLDEVVWRRSQEDLRTALLQPALGMPEFQLMEEQADTLIAVLLRDGNTQPGAESYQVFFRDVTTENKSVFGRLCGECHQVLGWSGPEGTAGGGPNLSGLLGPYYPQDEIGLWTRSRLEAWLRNPRAERAGATMPPVAVTASEMAELVELFTSVASE